MLAKKQNNAIAKTKESSLQGILRSGGDSQLVKFASKLNARKIYKNQAQVNELKVALEYLRGRYNTAEGDDKKYLKRKGESMKSELEALDYMPNLFEIKEQESEDEAIALLTVLITDMHKSFNVGKGMNASMIQSLAYIIIERDSSLTLEDVALCFHQAKAGVFGQVYDRLDINVVSSWLNKYMNERKELIIADQQNRHLGSKEGMSYDPADRASLVRVANDRGINTDDETRFQAFKTELKLKEEHAQARIDRKLNKRK